MFNEKEVKLFCEFSIVVLVLIYEWFKNDEFIIYDEGGCYRFEMDGILVIKEVDKD